MAQPLRYQRILLSNQVWAFFRSLYSNFARLSVIFRLLKKFLQIECLFLTLIFKSLLRSIVFFHYSSQPLIQFWIFTFSPLLICEVLKEYNKIMRCLCAPPFVLLGFGDCLQLWVLAWSITCLMLFMRKSHQPWYMLHLKYDYQIIFSWKCKFTKPQMECTIFAYTLWSTFQWRALVV